ncbi:MAG TPA: hypothetical protein VGN52_16675 [Burkholderiales bacterium]|jgi:hypothetical protein
MHPIRLISPRRARLPLLAALLLCGAALAQPPAKDILLPDNPADGRAGAPRSVEVVPPPPPTAEEKAAQKNIPRAKRIRVKDPKTGKTTYLYKCGDEFTDEPVCTAPIKPSTMRPTSEELARCKTFKNGNYLPWYCR